MDTQANFLKIPVGWEEISVDIRLSRFIAISNNKVQLTQGLRAVIPG